MDAAPTLRSVLAHVPVLPLPAGVLFPGIVLPLQLAEQPDRALVDDVLAGPRHLVLSLVRPPSGAAGCAPVARPAAALPPALHAVGCVARLIHARRLPQGGYSILLQGLERVALVHELPANRPYRCFRAEPFPPWPLAARPLLQAELARLQLYVRRLSERAALADPQLVAVLRATREPLALMDLLAAVLIPDPQQQQRLLATVDVRARVQQVTAALAAALLRLGPSVRRADAAAP